MFAPSSQLASAMAANESAGATKEKRGISDLIDIDAPRVAPITSDEM